VVLLYGCTYRGTTLDFRNWICPYRKNGPVGRLTCCPVCFWAFSGRAWALFWSGSSAAGAWYCKKRLKWRSGESRIMSICANATHSTTHNAVHVSPDRFQQPPDLIHRQIEDRGGAANATGRGTAGRRQIPATQLATPAAAAAWWPLCGWEGSSGFVAPLPTVENALATVPSAADHLRAWHSMQVSQGGSQHWQSASSSAAGSGAARTGR